MLKKLFILILLVSGMHLGAQTTLTEASDFHVKTIYGETIYLFPLLDSNNQIVVIDFFSTSCGPCQTYAPDFQTVYENFGYNESNVYLMGINWGSDNAQVHDFDSIFGLTYPTVSGSQGGGNLVYGDYNILSYPTVILITPDHQIVEQYIWEPNVENITNAILNAGGLYVGTDESIAPQKNNIRIFPQPATDRVTLQWAEAPEAEVKIKILNANGSAVLQQNANISGGNRSLAIETGHLPAGYYIIQINENNGMTNRLPLIITR